MNSDEKLPIRLDAIETQWSLVRKAHQQVTTSTGLETAARQAKETLVLRYANSIRNFVAMIVRDEIEADELAQDIVLRLMQGDFGGADPDRGRFRDLLKTAIRNMIKNHWAKKSRRKESTLESDWLVGGDASLELEEQWTRSWRDQILSLAWSQLENYEKERPGNHFYRLLKLRFEYPEAEIRELAEKILDSTGTPTSTDSVRQQLRRARIRFAEFVVDEVAQGLSDPEPERIREELISLGLFPYVKDFLPE